MRWAFTYFLGAVASLLGLTAILRIINNQPFPQHWSEKPLELAVMLLSITAGMGVVIFALLFCLSAVATRSALRASTYWGKRVTVPWSSITSIRAGSYQGLPALIIKSDNATAELYVYTLGLNRQEVHAQLHSFAGPNNMLTKCFAEDA
jgi:hypothetical protein